MINVPKRKNEQIHSIIKHNTYKITVVFQSNNSCLFMKSNELEVSLNVISKIHIILDNYVHRFIHSEYIKYFLYEKKYDEKYCILYWFYRVNSYPSIIWIIETSLGSHKSSDAHDCA